jgi:hypothetical protein
MRLYPSATLLARFADAVSSLHIFSLCRSSHIVCRLIATLTLLYRPTPSIHRLDSSVHAWGTRSTLKKMDQRKSSQSSAGWHKPMTSPSTPTGAQNQYPHIQPRPQAQHQTSAHGQTAGTVQFHHYQPPTQQSSQQATQYPVRIVKNSFEILHCWTAIAMSPVSNGY